MPGIRQGNFLWPGISGVISGHYDMCHGITPGCADVKVFPQQLTTAIGIGGTTSGFQMNGNLIITDGVGTVIIPGCKIDKIRQVEDGGAFVWHLEILDWRWKWRDAPGSLSGEYNVIDSHGKLIPRTIRSPYELAVLCLQAMGVSRYAIDLPPGLTKNDGETHFNLNPPWVGVIPTTGTNPYVKWINERPAQALETLCEQFGRRVVPRLSDYTITIVRPGIGGPLPPGAIAQQSPSIDTPEVPAGVAVYGDPTKFQMRLLLEPVGEDWDGHYRHINELSYTPTLPAAAQQSTITYAGTVGDTETFTAVINGFTFTYTAGPGETVTNVASGLSALINANGFVNTIVSSSASGGVLTISALQTNEPFTVSGDTSSANVSVTTVNTREAAPQRRSWERSPVGPGGFSDACGGPPTDGGEGGTDRLTYLQAVDLARKSVYKCFRVVNIDVSSQNDSLDASKSADVKRINVPGYGEINHRQQLVLLNTMAQQVVPVDNDQNLIGRDGQPLTVNFYNGYSRDMPARVFGSHRNSNNRILWRRHSGANTPTGSQVFVPFSINQDEQVVTFEDYLPYQDGAKNKDPGFVLETGVNVHDNTTNALVCHIESFPATTNLSGYFVQHYQDVQKNVIGNYNLNTNPVSSSGAFTTTAGQYPLHTLTNTSLLEQDAINRARYYLEGMKLQYFQNASEGRTYHGIEPINLDGAIQQVTWQIDDEGWASTQASLNTEHSVFVAPFPARRRAEFMRPTDQQNARNSMRNRRALPAER